MSKGLIDLVCPQLATDKVTDERAETRNYRVHPRCILCSDPVRYFLGSEGECGTDIVRASSPVPTSLPLFSHQSASGTIASNEFGTGHMGSLLSSVLRHVTGRKMACFDLLGMGTNYGAVTHKKARNWNRGLAKPMPAVTSQFQTF